MALNAVKNYVMESTYTTCLFSVIFSSLLKNVKFNNHKKGLFELLVEFPTPVPTYEKKK